jgi:hypothetical protein
MSKQRARWLAFGVIAATVVAVAGGGYWQAQAKALQGPDDWVPFVADITVTERGHITTGLFYRNADGSTRIEAFSPDKTESLITIHNLTERISHLRGAGGAWASTPLKGNRRTPLRNLPNAKGTSKKLRFGRGLR